MNWKPIIVGVDGTPESLRAAELAAKLAHAARAQLIPVLAVPAIPAFTGAGGLEPMPQYPPGLQDEINRSAHAQVARALAKVLTPAALERLEVQTGPAPFILAEAARRHHAELVVVGGKHHGALARGLGRSTAHYLVRTLDVPVLVAGQAPAAVTRILAAVDLSPASLPTMRVAERIAALCSAEIRLLHVVEPIRFIALSPDQWDEAAYERHSQEMFDRFATQYDRVPRLERVVRKGYAAEIIAAEAAAWQADIIVAGSHGKGWVDRVLVGSTTQRLVTELPVSVLVVPAHASSTQAKPERRPRSAARRRAAPVGT